MAFIVSFILLLSTSLGDVYAFQLERYKCAKLPNIPPGPFYLRLAAPALMVNEDVNEGSCPVNDVRINDLSCMCGKRLEDQQRAIEDRLNATCEHYRERIIDNPSPLGFCERSLTQTGWCATFEPTQSDNMYTFTNASLKEKLSEVNNILLGYFGVLDRTIVHVYLPSNGHRCQCLEYYKRWLCATKLNFVTNNTTNTSTLSVTESFNSSTDVNAPNSVNDTSLSNVSNSSDGFSPSSNVVENNLEENVEWIRPCLGVCYDVLQTCPYYLPSKFQPKPKTNSTQEFFEVIYGGYPAFDCPRRKYCEQQLENCTYGPETFCFGRKSGSTLISSQTVRLIIIQLLLLLLCNL